MNKLTTKQLIYINESLANLVGLKSGVADPALLEYVTNAPYELNESGDFYVYKNVVDKAAKTLLLFSENKPFMKLNVKTGVITAVTLLELNGIRIHFTQEELCEIVNLLMTNMLTFEGIRAQLTQHINFQVSHGASLLLTNFH